MGTVIKHVVWRCPHWGDWDGYPDENPHTEIEAGGPVEKIDALNKAAAEMTCWCEARLQRKD